MFVRSHRYGKLTPQHFVWGGPQPCTCGVTGMIGFTPQHFVFLEGVFRHVRFHHSRHYFGDGSHRLEMILFLLYIFMGGGLRMSVPTAFIGS